MELLLDSSKRQLAVGRIINGITYINIGGSLYKKSSPTKEQKALAELIYKETMNDAKFNGLMTREQAKFTLAERKIWTPENDEQYKVLSKYLEDLKVDLYKALYNKKKQKAARKKIKQVNSGLLKSINKKYSLDNITLEQHAETTRDEFLIAICITDRWGDQVYTYENWDESDTYILQKFITASFNESLTNDDYRELARLDPFRSLWSIGKEKVFGVSICELSYEQKSLILYSRMYDNVYENPEQPSEDVIKDDDMLDGWFIIERRKSDQSRNKKEVDRLLDSKGAKGSGGELFVMAETAEEANKIKGLNDLTTSMKLKQRDAALKAQGRLDESQLPDVKLDLRNQAMRQIAERGK